MGAARQHKKRSSGAKAKKKKDAAAKKGGVKKILDSNIDAAKQRNPRAFVTSSGGNKARRARARTAEKDQRRLHGTSRTST